MKDAGLIDKWPVYFDHTSRLQHICRKYCMEKARKCDEMAGFELLGMMDMHFTTPEYAVGMVDEFLADETRRHAEGIRRYNDESVLLLDFDAGNGASIAATGRATNSGGYHGFALRPKAARQRHSNLATNARWQDTPRKERATLEHSAWPRFHIEETDDRLAKRQ